MPAECQLGRRFSRCRRPSSHTCQYCARNFCDLHTYLVEGHEAVCSRKECAAKQADMVAHEAYRKAAFGRNSARLCGEPDCTSTPPAMFECSLCRGHFCADHVHDRLYWTPDGLSRNERTLSLCAHCWERRKIWQKR